MTDVQELLNCQLQVLALASGEQGPGLPLTFLGLVGLMLPPLATPHPLPPVWLEEWWLHQPSGGDSGPYTSAGMLGW